MLLLDFRLSKGAPWPFCSATGIAAAVIMPTVELSTSFGTGPKEVFFRIDLRAFVPPALKLLLVTSAEAVVTLEDVSVATTSDDSDTTSDVVVVLTVEDFVVTDLPVVTSEVDFVATDLPVVISEADFVATALPVVTSEALLSTDADFSEAFLATLTLLLVLLPATVTDLPEVALPETTSDDLRAAAALLAAEAFLVEASEDFLVTLGGNSIDLGRVWVWFWAHFQTNFRGHFFVLLN